MAHNWTCPYCQTAQVVTAHNSSSGSVYHFTGEDAPNKLGVTSDAVCCANPDCKRHTVDVIVRRWDSTKSGKFWLGEYEPDFSRQILPESTAKPQPEFIPAPLTEDYYEACIIRDLSPKASATLSRRCLQGMIRDFTGIKKGRLIDEINKLKELVDDDTAPKGVSDDSVEAIDAVRKIGNIGAHMEKDINLVIEVDRDEAQILIELIETLFDEWYVEREKRQTRFAKLIAIAEEKDAQKQIAVEEIPRIEPPTEE
ncbi:MAG: DUF4145 domain-containing protein [Pseudomonadota bacterium]